MGYILLFVFILIWLNVRKIRKAINYIAVQNGYPGNLKSQILDVVSEYHIERVESKKLKKAAKKIYKEVQDEKN